MRTLVMCTALAGCTPPTVTAYTTAGEKVQPAYLVMAPLCLLICPVTVTTSAVDSDTVGAGATGGTTTTSHTISPAMGGT